ncbi:InlB B-repeat-containing protein [Paenibacillus luteus]|uniref:InlB B-repeat-containing protein n=1 Tax=Paenibacillus luteus TaxID=2545753 RepID=UPI001143123F|nr:InlB B-repeat-containing protein [Paenibacillus luteus]
MNKANYDFNWKSSGNYFNWKKVRIVLLTIVLGISGLLGQLVQGGNHAYAAVSEWEAVGETGLSVSSGAYWYTKMVVYDGIPYIAFTDVRNAQKATVMKYVGNSWVTVGNAGFSAGTTAHLSLQVYEGTPYLAYVDGGNANKATVMKYNGSSWETVGNAGLSAGGVDYTSLYVHEGTPYLAYKDGGHSNKATVMKFNGSVWEPVGSVGFSAGDSSWLSMHMDKGIPYLAFSDNGDSQKPFVMKYNETNLTWETVGGAALSANAASHISLYVSDGLPFVSYRDGGNANKATVMKYNGNSWETVGNAGFSTGGVNNTSLHVNEGTPYVAYNDSANASKATLMMLNGSSWEPVGNDGFSANAAYYTSLYIDDGTPYVVYHDVGNYRNVVVMKAMKKFTVNYDANGASLGSAPSGSSYGNNTSVTVLNNTGNLVKTGYTFAGWNTAMDGSGTDYAAGDIYTMGAADVTLYAHWSANSYTLAYDGNGASSGSAPNGGSYAYNTGVTLLGNTGHLVKTGYTFAGWNTEADGSGTNYAAGDTHTMGASGVTLYARWTVNSYTVSYDGNGAISGSAPSGGSYAYNTSVTVLGNTGSLVKTGHTFAGWNTMADGSGTNYASGGTYTIGASGVTLYARWTVNSYTVSYDGNGAISGSAPSGGSYAYNTSVTVLGNTGSLVQTGHTFAGWNTAADGSGTNYAAGSTYTVDAAGVILYAQWAVNSYTLAYDGNGASSGSAPNGGSYAYNTSVTVLGNTGSLVKTGHTFAGWNTAADGSGTDYAAGDTHTMGASGVTLYARWTVNSYTVSYDGNGAISGSAPSGGSYAYNTSVTVLGNTGSLVKTGHTFAGWNTMADGSGTNYASSGTYTMGAVGVTLYAQWTANSYLLAYDGNGASLGSVPSGGSYVYNTGVVVLGNTGSLVKVGYTFSGWNTAADGSGTGYAAGGTFMMGAAGATLYAQWTIANYTVAYDGNGETTGSAPNGGSYAYNTSVTVLGNTGSLVKTGHTFAGWNTAADGNGTDYAAGDTYTLGASGVILYAHWTANSYTVSYDGNGAISGSAPSGGSYEYKTGVTMLGNTGNLVRAGYAFVGWNTTADGSGTDYAAGETYTMGASGVILYAQWSVNSYTVSYDGNGAISGSVPIEGSYAYNTSVTVLGNTGILVKTGHTFVGWNTAADGSGTDYAAGGTYTMGAAGVTLYAQWTVNSYTVSYDGNGAISGSAPSGGSYAYNTSVTVLGNTSSLVKIGYTFAGWNTAADGSGTDYAAGGTYTMGAAGVTLYAQWTANSYLLAYDGNGASLGNVPSGGSYVYNMGVVVLGNTGSLVKVGYTFSGWNTAADGSGTDFAAGGTYTMGAAGVVLYAKWTIGNYTVTYDGNGAISGSVPTGGSYDYDAGVIVWGNTGNLTKMGYVLSGWNTATDGSGTDYVAGDTYTMGASGVILYAQWTANSYMLAYDVNGASSGSAPSGGSYEYNTGVTVLGNTGNLVRTGYAFTGWNTTADGSGTDYAAGGTYTMGAADVTLYAQWSANSYTLAYDGNGTSSGSAPSGGSYEYNTAIVVLWNTGSLVKAGYTFAGWNTAADGSGTDYAAGGTYTMGAAGVVLYAKWTIANYTVTYDGNGAISGSAPTGGSYDYNAGVTVLGNTGSLVKTGYTFAGWNTAADGSGTNYMAGETHMMGVSGVTLYAQWTLDSYIVSFDSNGGAAVASQTVSNSSTASKPVAPTKNGYTFDGWYTNSNLTEAFEFDTAITGDITLYARWKQASPTGSSSGTAGSAQKEEITVNVKDGEHVKISIGSTVVITRAADSSGKKKDKATFTAIEAAKTVEQLKAIGSHAALLVVPDLGDKVSELLFTLPSESSDQLAKGDIGLNIATTHAWLKLPVDAMKDLKESTFFRITPLKDGEEQRELSARAALSTSVSAAIGDSGIKMIGVPVGFETNLKDHTAILELPLVNTGLNKEQFSYLGVYMERSDGKVELIRGKIAYDDVTGDPVIRIAVSKFSVFNTFAVVYSAGFSAIKEDVFIKAYITGYADGTFHPGNSVTRAEMAALLARAFSGEKAQQNDRDYSDVRSSHWAAAAIEEVTKLALMNGFTDGTFKPAQIMTRGEMAAIVIRLLKSDASGEESFTDTAGHWADMAIKSVKAAGIMNGYADGTFRPNQAITRAEAVVIINRLLGRQPLINLEPAFTDVPAAHWAYGQIQAASIDHLSGE